MTTPFIVVSWLEEGTDCMAKAVLYIFYYIITYYATERQGQMDLNVDINKSQGKGIGIASDKVKMK